MGYRYWVLDAGYWAGKNGKREERVGSRQWAVGKKTGFVQRASRIGKRGSGKRVPGSGFKVLSSRDGDRWRTVDNRLEAVSEKRDSENAARRQQVVVLFCP
jgi:hypothetical protein